MLAATLLDASIMKKTKHPMNPMNEFIYQKLLASKKSFVEANEGKLLALYDRILSSLSRYPLPILSGNQARMLEGVNDKMAEYIGNLVQINYLRHFHSKEALHTLYAHLSNSNELENPRTNQKSKLEVESKRSSIRESPKENESPQESRLPSINEKEHSNNLDEYCFRNVQPLTSANSLPKKRPADIDDSEGKPSKKRQMSQNSFKPTLFVPEENSNSWAILVAMYYWQKENGKKYVAKREIKEAYTSMSQKYNIEWKISSWEAMKVLLKHEYVVSFSFDVEKFALTDIGEDLARSLFETNIFNGAPKPDKSNEIQIMTSDVQETTNREEDCLSPDFRFTIRGSEIISSKLWLYINNQDPKANAERSHIFQSLTASGVSCLFQTMPIADFLWVLEINAKGKQDSILLALDHLVERKTIDSVASSIIDGRFNYHQYRLKAAGITNVHYCLEGRVPKGGALLSTILSAQLVNGFSLKYLNDVEGSIALLRHMTNVIGANIEKQIESNSNLTFPSTFESFVLKNERTQVTVTNVFRDMLKGMKGINAENVNTILHHFRTPLSLFEKLMGFESVEDVITYFNTGGGKGRRRQLKEADQSTKIYSKILSILFTQAPYPNC